MEIKLFVRESGAWQQVQSQFRTIWQAVEYCVEHLPSDTKVRIQADKDVGRIEWDEHNGYGQAVFP